MRGAGSALLFALPILMTQEMWTLGGFAAERMRLLVFLIISMPMLLGLSYFAGFEPTFCLKDEIFDALAAFGIGFLVSASALWIFAVFDGVSLAEAMGKIAICTVPAAVGALLGGKQFAQREDDDTRDRGPLQYPGVLFMMTVGAIFLAFNIAPTDEMVVITHMMGPGHALLLIAVSLLLLHLFVYAVGFPGETQRRGEAGVLRNVLVYTLPGYAISLAISLYCLWTFGRLEVSPCMNRRHGRGPGLSLGARRRHRSTGCLNMPATRKTAAKAKPAVKAQASKVQGKLDKILPGDSPTPLLEWAAALIGLVVLILTVGVIASEAFKPDDSPPSIIVQQLGVSHTEAGYRVDIRATNRGGSAAAQVLVEGELQVGEAQPETAQATFDFIADHSSSEGGLFFDQDPALGKLTLKAKGYIAP